MTEERPPGFLDRVVDGLAQLLDSLGLNGTRLRWKWNQRQRAMAESGMRSEILLRSARGKHKMCRSCRALVDKSETTCPECGESLAGIRGPGVGRLLANLLPGAGSATPLILLVNGALFLLMLLAQIQTGGGRGLGLFTAFDGQLMARYGSGLSYMTLTQGEWWRFVTPIFLHAGLLHFFFNSYVLMQLGPLVEEEFDSQRFWFAYLACGIAGSAASQIVRPVNTVGASGAILGLMGLLLVYGWRRGGVAGHNLKSMMLRYAAFIVIFSLLWRGVDHVNHAGGFVCGALLGLVLPDGELRSKPESNFWQVVSVAGVALVLYVFYQAAVHGENFRQFLG